MRTAKDIIEEYRHRGYDSFRLRAIAALRPEPMRSQILEILDMEGSTDGVEENDTVETTTDSEITPSLIMEEMTESGEIEIPADANINSEKSDNIAETVPAEISIVTEIEMHDQKIAEAAAEEAVKHSEPNNELDAESDFWDNESIEILAEDEDFEPVAVENTENDDTNEEVEEEMNSDTENEQEEAIDVNASETDSTNEVMEFEELSDVEEVVEKSEENTETDTENTTAEESDNNAEEVINLIDQGISMIDDNNTIAEKNVLTDEVIKFHVNVSEEFEAALIVQDELEKEQAVIEESGTLDEIGEESVSEETAESDIMAENPATGDNNYQKAAADLIEQWAEIQNNKREESLPEIEAINLESNEDDEIDELLAEATAPDISTENSNIDTDKNVNDTDNQLSLITNEDYEVSYKEDNDTEEFVEEDAEESNILYMFDSVKNKAEEEIAETQLKLIKNEDASSKDEWHDYGSGLIMFPKDMADMHQAYTDALNRFSNDEPVQEEAATSEEDITLEQLVEAIESESAAVAEISPVDQLIDKIETNPEMASDEIEFYENDFVIEAECPAIEKSEKTYGIDEDQYSKLKAEMMELEKSLNIIESSLHHKVKETEELSKLIYEKDKLINMQKMQNEENLAKLTQTEATVMELEAASKNMHNLSEKIMALNIEKEELERERNILKSEIIPSFEEQQLSLVEMVEEEMTEKDHLKIVAKKSRNRAVVSYSVAVAATLCMSVVPMLDWMSETTGIGTSSEIAVVSENISLQEESLRKTIDAQATQIAQLTQEKDALYNSFIQAKADYKEKEGELLHKVSLIKSQLDQRQEEIAREMNKMKLIRDTALENSSKVNPVSFSAKNQAQEERLPEKKADNTRYIVKSGDTLSEIVKQFYGKTDNGRLVKKVAKANGLRNPNDIRINQELKLAAISDY